MDISKAITDLQKVMDKEGINPEHGLGDELFLFSSTLTPIVNVDLLVVNEKKQVLLSWRNDNHNGIGWHIPGGCIRFKESFRERIQKTALVELGACVIFREDPIQVYEIFTDFHRDQVENQNERSHFITLAFECHLPEGYDIKQYNQTPNVNGFLKWFDVLPDNLLRVQDCYRIHWHEICNIIWRNT